MDLTGIIAISGKPGLFKVVTQGKNNIIVESLVDNKRIPAYATDRISALDDISIYTYDEDKPLRELFTVIHTKEDGKATLSHKDDLKKLEAYLLEILPNYDKERVYSSDIKKIFQWYNMLLSSGNLKLSEAPAEEVAAKPATKAKAKAEDDAAAAPKAEKKPAAKKVAATAKPKAAGVAPKSAAKPSGGAKKVATVKTGGGRGK
ncbi:MAG: DUF5606 domain-containing protein [Bacteroidota bacterium]